MHRALTIAVAPERTEELRRFEDHVITISVLRRASIKPPGWTASATVNMEQALNADIDEAPRDDVRAQLREHTQPGINHSAT